MDLEPSKRVTLAMLVLLNMKISNALKSDMCRNSACEKVLVPGCPESSHDWPRSGTERCFPTLIHCQREEDEWCKILYLPTSHAVISGMDMLSSFTLHSSYNSS
ncbi:hypothetical protein SUGI_0201510 [Cryptomeria japonica]|nr:hypothetical protein SUGI_0201510 [Cryptomeria japonica]